MPLPIELIELEAQLDKELSGGSEASAHASAHSFQEYLAFIRSTLSRTISSNTAISTRAKAFPLIHEVSPAAWKKFRHSSGVKRPQISPMASMS